MSCHGYFQQTHGAPFHGKRVSPDLLGWAVGALAAIEQVLAARGWHINTTFIERLNLAMRQHVAAVGRRVTTLCKGEDGLRPQLTLYHAYYNVCLPHASLRQPLLQPEPTHGTGSAKQWRPFPQPWQPD